MGKTCIVCGSSAEKERLLNFHKFPTNKDRRCAWLKACKLDETSVRSSSVICSRHFEDLNYNSAIKTLRKLHPHAVPFVDIPQAGSTSSADVSIIVPPRVKDVERDNLEETVTSPPKEPKMPRYIGDLSTHHFSTPRKAKRNLEFVKNVVDYKNKKFKKLSIQTRRLEQRISSVAELLSELREQELISQEASDTILDGTPDFVHKLLDRQFMSKNTKYTPELRSFALTLHFYSVNAYNYVREEFKDLLPHSDTIRKWYLVIDGSPGFTKESFEAIKLLEQEGSRTFVNLTVDEMSIREMVQYEHGKYYGYVDLGTGLQNDCDYKEKAKHALVFMAVALNSHYKIPVGYFLISRLNAKERANLITTCLKLLYEAGASCYSLTFDGAPVNIAMCNELGTNYHLDEEFRPWFNTKFGSNNRINTIWDACHMIKLIRNTLAEKETLINGNGQKIEWRFIVMLHKVQKEEGLNAATKLTSRHIFYKNEIMKVRLAVQTLSTSVSSALLFCKNLNIDDFEDCEATAEFCLVINNVFDILNSRHLCSKNKFNCGLSYKNHDFVKDKVEEYITYIRNIKDAEGSLIIKSRRKTGFLGFIVSLTSLFNLYQDLIVTKYMKFILTYKLSQDHIEIFFGAIRRRGGQNNNPSALHFKTSYKRLLVKHQIKSSTKGNCSILDHTAILHVGSGVRIQLCDTLLEDGICLLLSEQDYDFCTNVINMSPFLENVVKYISGFVVKKVGPKIICEICNKQLYGEQSQSLLLDIKKRGNLNVASDDVNILCIKLEGIIRQYQGVLHLKLNIAEFLMSHLFRNLGGAFSNSIMTDHILSQDILDNHKVTIIKMIAEMYIKIRIHYEAKKLNDVKYKIRSKLTKCILFHNE